MKEQIGENFCFQQVDGAESGPRNCFSRSAFPAPCL